MKLLGRSSSHGVTIIMNNSIKSSPSVSANSIECGCPGNENSALRLSPWELARMTIDSAKGFLPNYSWFSMSRVLSFAAVYALYVYSPCVRASPVSRRKGPVKGVARVTSWSNLRAARFRLSIPFSTKDYFLRPTFWFRPTDPVTTAQTFQ